MIVYLIHYYHYLEIFDKNYQVHTNRFISYEKKAEKKQHVHLRF